MYNESLRQYITAAKLHCIPDTCRTVWILCHFELILYLFINIQRLKKNKDSDKIQNELVQDYSSTSGLQRCCFIYWAVLYVLDFQSTRFLSLVHPTHPNSGFTFANVGHLCKEIHSFLRQLLPAQRNVQCNPPIKRTG